MDFYLLTSVINMFWQIFTILFVLYRFTSFFSMMYNFFLFLSKILKGVVYVKDQISLYISRKRGYSYLSNDEINGLPNGRPNNSWFTKIKEWVFRKSTDSHIPLYETRTSYMNMNASSNFPEREEVSSPRSSKNDFDFENHMNNMMNPNYQSSEFYGNKNLKSSIYPPQLDNRKSQSQPIESSLTPTVPLTPTVSKSSLTDANKTANKPFNVDDSNMLFNSQFLIKMLQPFSSNEQIEKDENKDELEKALLNSDYDNV